MAGLRILLPCVAAPHSGDGTFDNELGSSNIDTRHQPHRDETYTTQLLMDHDQTILRWTSSRGTDLV